MNHEENWQTKFLNKGTEEGLGDLSIMISTVSAILASQKEKIHKDLLEIADKGEYEDLRREIENYF